MSIKTQFNTLRHGDHERNHHDHHHHKYDDEDDDDSDEVEYFTKGRSRTRGSRPTTTSRPPLC